MPNLHKDSQIKNDSSEGPRRNLPFGKTDSEGIDPNTSSERDPEEME